VFLDRDGVITRADVRDGKPFAPMTFESLEILAGVHDALQRLAASGYLLIVATNQPDVGHGRQAREVVERMHRHQDLLPCGVGRLHLSQTAARDAARRGQRG
jgi:D-glycero-D-manno-heptose 1,7-bisphosphate phosphatase